MTIGERVRLLRKSTELNLTAEKFSERLGVSRSAITNIEIGNKVPSDQLIRSICREFKVSEAWLRDGVGEMFVQKSRNEQLQDMIDGLGDGPEDEFKLKFLTVLSRLSNDQWNVVEQIIDMFLEEASEEEALRKSEELMAQRFLSSTRDDAQGQTEEESDADIGHVG